MKSKYASMIDRLFIDGGMQQQVYDELVKSKVRALSALTAALRGNNSSSVREVCAEIIKDIGKARAIPALMDALHDEALAVRQDALWAIGTLAGYSPGGLESLLQITNIDRQEHISRQVRAWWKANKKFIQDNPEVW